MTHPVPIRYEHKTVGLDWFRAADWQENRPVRRANQNLGASHYHSDGDDRTIIQDEAGWHVVGVIPGSGSSETFFLMERAITYK